MTGRLGWCGGAKTLGSGTACFCVRRNISKLWKTTRGIGVNLFPFLLAYAAHLTYNRTEYNHGQMPNDFTIQRFLIL